MDYNYALYSPIYVTLGVDAILTPGTGGTSVNPIRAIDKTAGVTFTDDYGVETIRAAATIRTYDLVAAGLEREDLINGEIEMNGNTWSIYATRPKPSPQGESVGEIYLFLVEA